MSKPDQLHHPQEGGQHSRQVEDRGQRGEGALRDVDPDSEGGAVHLCRSGVSSGAALLQHKVLTEEYLSQVSWTFIED